MRRGAEGDRGAVLLVVAISLVTLITFAAMAVDLGRLMIKRRDLQALVDVVSMDLIRDLNGGTEASYDLGNPNSTMNLHKAQSVARNNGSGSTVTLDLGCVTGKGATFDTSCAVPNAVKASATGSVTYFFAQVIGQSSGTTTRTAIATRTPTLDAGVGSFLANVSLSQPGVDLLNGLTNGWLGASSISTTAVGWQGLASTGVTLSQVAAQMGLASPDQLLTSNVSAYSFFKAVVDAGAGNGATTGTIAAGRAFQTAVSNTAQLNVGSFLGSASSGYGSFADVKLSMLELLEGGAQVINGTNTVSVPTLNINVAGFANVAISLKLGQGFTICRGMTTSSTCPTKQVDATITTTISGLSVASLLPGLTSPVVNGTVTTHVTVAGATIQPTAIGCPTDAGASTTISLTADPVTTTASENLTLAAKVLGISVDLLQVTQATTSVGSSSSGGSATFAYPSEFMPPTYPGGTKHLGATSFSMTAALSSPPATATLLSLPLGQTLSGLIGAVNSILASTIVPTITDTILPLTLAVASVELGGGDVGAFELHCTTPLLAG